MRTILMILGALVIVRFPVIAGTASTMNNPEMKEKICDYSKKTSIVQSEALKEVLNMGKEHYPHTISRLEETFHSYYNEVRLNRDFFVKNCKKSMAPKLDLDRSVIFKCNEMKSNLSKLSRPLKNTTDYLVSTMKPYGTIFSVYCSNRPSVEAEWKAIESDLNISQKIKRILDEKESTVEDLLAGLELFQSKVKIANNKEIVDLEFMNPHNERNIWLKKKITDVSMNTDEDCNSRKTASVPKNYGDILSGFAPKTPHFVIPTFKLAD